jgi:hypothetical protein
MGIVEIWESWVSSRYRSVRCREWIKVKNRAHPAFERAMLTTSSKRTGFKITVTTARPVGEPREV